MWGERNDAAAEFAAFEQGRMVGLLAGEELGVVAVGGGVDVEAALCLGVDELLQGEGYGTHGVAGVDFEQGVYPDLLAVAVDDGVDAEFPLVPLEERTVEELLPKLLAEPQELRVADGG